MEVIRLPDEQEQQDNIFERTALLLHSICNLDTDISTAPYQSMNILIVCYLCTLIDLAQHMKSPVVGVDTLKDGLTFLTDLIYLNDSQQVAERLQAFGDEVQSLEKISVGLHNAMG